MADEERRRKPFEQCSRRHQRRIIQEDITKLYLQKLQYMHSYDNSVKVDSCNIFHNDAVNTIFVMKCILMKQHQVVSQIMN